MIELPERRAADILNEFNNDYESMASSLQVMNKRLVLLNPKFINQKRLATAPVGQGGRPPIPGQANSTGMSMTQQLPQVMEGAPEN